MAKEIEFNGDVYEFPDEATRGQVTVFLRKKAGLDPHGNTPQNEVSKPTADFSQKSLVGDTLSGMGGTVKSGASAVGDAVSKVAEVAQEAAGGSPVKRTEQIIDLFAAPGKTPTENIARAAKKFKSAAERTVRETATDPSALAFPPFSTISQFGRNLLDSAETPPDPARESTVQRRNEQEAAAQRAIDAKFHGTAIDPADRLALAKTKAGDVPRPPISDTTGLMEEPLPERPGGLYESAARGVAKFPAKLAEIYTDPTNAAIMGGQGAAMKVISALPIPPAARAAAQVALGPGMTGYFLHGMSGQAGEAAGRAASGGMDQRFLEQELPDQAANLAFVGHMTAGAGKPIAESVEGARSAKIKRDTITRVEAAREGALNLAKENAAKGRPIYEGMTPDQLASVAPAQIDLQRFVGADDLESMAKAAFSSRPDIRNVQIHEDGSTLPSGVQPLKSEILPTIEGAFDGSTGTIHLVRDQIATPMDLARVAMHEGTHGLEGIPAPKVAATSERLFKQEILGLAEEGVIGKEQAESLLGLTGKDFVAAVRALDTGENSPMKRAADEVLAVQRQAGFQSENGRLIAEPQVGPVNRALGRVANAIPGVELTPADVTSVMASQARAKQGPVADRQVGIVGEAPYYQGRVTPEPMTPSAPPPPEPPKPISVGDRAVYTTKSGKTYEGVVEKQSKSGKTVALRTDDGKLIRAEFESLSRPVEKPAEAAPVAPEPQVAAEVQQPVPEQQPVAAQPVPEPQAPPVPTATPEQMDAIFARADQQQAPKPKRERPSVPEGLDEVYDPRLRAEEDAWSPAIERLRNSPEVQRYRGQGVNKGNIDAVRKVILRRGEPLLQAYAKEAAKQALGIETPIHPRQLRKTAVAETPLVDAVLEGKSVTPGADVLEANPNVRWSRKPYDFKRAQVNPEMNPEEWRNFAEKQMEAYGVPRERHDGVDQRGLYSHDMGDGDKIIAVYGPEKMDAAARISPKSGVLWMWGEKGGFRPQESPFWREGNDNVAKLGRWLALRDESRPYVQLQREIARNGVRRDGNELYSEKGARGIDETMIPPPQAVSIIDGFRGEEHKIASALGVSQAWARKGIADLVEGVYDSPEAMDVVQWSHGALRESYAAEHGVRWTPGERGRSAGVPAEVRQGAVEGNAGESAGAGAAPAVGDGRGAGEEVVPFPEAETPLVIRERGHEAANDNVNGLSRPGHLYRGMTSGEFDATVGAGRGIKSSQDYSVRGEGTSFSDDAATAESYVNFGRDDPRKTGRPTYLVEVSAGPDVTLDKRDGYHKAAAEIPADRVTRIFRMEANDGAVLAHEIAPPAGGDLRLSRSRPNDKILRPLLGDLVDLSAQMMADKKNGIRDADALFTALTAGMGEGYAKAIGKGKDYLFEQAQKAAAERADAVSVVRQALEQHLEPNKKLGTSKDEATASVQKAVDYAREAEGLPETKADVETLAAGTKLYENLGPRGIQNLVIERAQHIGGTLTDAETVAAKLALQNPDANKKAMQDPRIFAERVAFNVAYRLTGTEQARSFRQRRFDITAPLDERVKSVLYDVLLDEGGNKVTPNDLKGAEQKLKELKKFLKDEVGVEDIESIPIEKLTDEAFMTDLVRNWSSHSATKSMKARTWYLNSLVSAFKTHAANVTGNVMNFGIEYLAHRQLEARLNQMFKIDGVLPSDLKGMAAQLLKVQKQAWADASQYLQTGKNRLEEAVFGADWVEQLRKQKRSFSGKAGTVIEAPTRLLGTEDAYFVSLAGHMEALVMARRLARKALGDGKVGSAEYNALVDKQMGDYGSEAWNRGMKRAEYLTFKDETGKFVRSLLALRRQHPNLTYIAPFLTTPVNLIARGTEFVPGVGLVGRGFFKNVGELRRGTAVDPEFNKGEISRLAAAQAIGIGASLITAALGATAFKDDDEPWITGSEPPRQFGTAERDARRRSLQPYTVKLPFSNERISYRRLDPISTAIGLNVDLINILRDYYRTGDTERLMQRGKNAVLGQLVGKAFLKGPGDWIDWIRDDTGTAQFPLVEVATGFYPNALRQIPQALDPYVRETKAYGTNKGEEGQGLVSRFIQTKLARTTGFPMGLEPKVNLYGEEVQKTGNPLYRMLVPFDRYGEEGISPEGRAIDLRYLRSLDHMPEGTESLPSESGPKMGFGPRKFKLFPEDWAEFEKTRGQLLKDVASQAGITSDPNKPLEPWQIELLRKAAQAGADQAKGKLAPKYLK